MDFDSEQMSVLIRKLPMNSIRLLYRSVCNHPFLVGFACLLLLLFRSFPLLLSLLISASPVLFCTALLLGTLLSFGQANIPEIEKEGNVVTREIAALQGRVSKSATVVERDVSSTMERLAGLRADIIDKAKEQANSVEKKACEIGNVIASSVNNVLSADDKPRENTNRKHAVDEEESVDLVLEKKIRIHEEKSEAEGMSSDAEEIENQNSSIGQKRDENLEMETDKSPVPVDSMGSHTRRRLDSEEDDVGNEKSSDDESDWAESSSSDASMADIIPMLDELHPLLDEDAPHPIHMSHDGSDHDDIIESDEDSENKGEEVDGDDEDDDEEEEATPWNNGHASSSPIIWTQDDHKNVIDIGTLEIERNQRLESLIARMKARKTVSMDSADLPFNVPPVTTIRHNPFDVPDDSYNDMGLPPVPGSAPSIMLPRKNPFDVPDDSYYDMGLPPIPGSAPSIMMPGQNPFDTPFDEVEISMGDLDIRPILEAGDATTTMELKRGEIHQKPEPIDEEYSSRSIISSLPEVMPGVNQGARKLELKDTHTEEYVFSKPLDDSQQHGDVYFQSEHDKFHTPTSYAEVHRDVPKKFDSLGVERVSMVHPSSVGIGHIEEQALNKEEAPQFGQKEVHSSSYNTNASSGLH